jgi:hypothetical protein
VKTVLIFVMVGAIVGAVAASFVVPPILSWYSEPGAIAPGKPPQTICDPAFMIYYTASHLFRWQLVGAGLGALLFLYPGIAIARRSRATGPLAAA